MTEPSITDRKREEEIVGLDQAYLIQSQPRSAEDWYRKGDALDDIEKREEAIACFDKCLALKPDHGRAHYFRGFSLFVLGRKQEALEAYNNAIRYEPKLVIAYVNRGKVYISLQKEKESLADLAKAQELSRGGLRLDECLTQANIAWIQNTLGSIVELQKTSQEFEACINEAGQSHPVVIKHMAKYKLYQEDKKKNINKAFELLNRQDDVEAVENTLAVKKTRDDLRKVLTEMKQELGKVGGIKDQVNQAQQDIKKQVDKNIDDVQAQLKKVEDAKNGVTGKFEDNKKELNNKADEAKKNLEANKEELNKQVDDMKKKMEGATDIKALKGQNGRACCNMF